MYERLVKEAWSIEEGVELDVEKYLMLLYSSAANKRSFEGYTTKSVFDSIQDQKQEAKAEKQHPKSFQGYSRKRICCCLKIITYV